MFEFLSVHELNSLLATYGYLAVLLLVAVESTGIPVPGETMLITAAMYAGTSHRLQAGLVVAAAAIGAVLGDNLGFMIGREGGHRLLRRYGRYVRLDERKLRVSEHLFYRHGGKVVFFGRFVALLRIWAAFLAGANRMPWGRFLLFNAAGGILWALIYGLGGYGLGNTMAGLGGMATLFGMALTGVIGLALAVAMRRHERRLASEVECQDYALAA
jgi:membrane protein DedA with SNARE-associated domain